MQKVIPAILTDDSAELQRQLGILKNHTKWVQIDVMDGRFVPSVSVNLSELGEAHEFFSLELHLMVQDPQHYVEDCRATGAKRVYVHYEGTEDIESVLSAMEKYPFQKGVAINPETPVERIQPVLEKVSAVLLLSVVPGAQGHEFIPAVAEKVRQIRDANPKLAIGMDGGIGKDNIKQVFRAGVDYAAVGSSIWKTPDPVAALRELEEMIS